MVSGLRTALPPVMPVVGMGPCRNWSAISDRYLELLNAKRRSLFRAEPLLTPARVFLGHIGGLKRKREGRSFVKNCVLHVVAMDGIEPSTSRL